MAKVGARPRLLVITIKVVGFPRVPTENHLRRIFLGLQLLLKMIFYMLRRKGVYRVNKPKQSKRMTWIWDLQLLHRYSCGALILAN